MLDIETGIALGRYQFWAGERSAIVTELIHFPRLTALNYFLIGGDLSELKTMEPRISAWAKTMGCSRVLGVGRAGFERAFKQAGFTRRWTVIAKELT